MNFVFRKDSGKSPKNSLKVAFCACKWKFGSTTVHCSNSVMHELWTMSCASNERREAYLSIHVHLIKQIYDYDSKKLQWNSVSFILGRTVLQAHVHKTDQIHVLVLFFMNYLLRISTLIFSNFNWDGSSCVQRLSSNSDSCTSRNRSLARIESCYCRVLKLEHIIQISCSFTLYWLIYSFSYMHGIIETQIIWINVTVQITCNEQR